MGDLTNKNQGLPLLPIIGQGGCALSPQELPRAGERARPRVPDWVYDDQFLESLGPEFAENADLPPEGSTRRQFLQVMGASVALATASGCFNRPQEKIVPYVRPPEELVPGKPLYYATAMTLGGSSMGLLAETHMGRPTKVDGNPLHPAVPSAKALAEGATLPDAVVLGASDAFAQATVLSLYDPDRSQTVVRNGQISTWDIFYSELRSVLERLAPHAGEGLRVLTPPVLSPTLANQLQQLVAKYPNVRLHRYEPVNDDNAIAGSRLAFGEVLEANYTGAPEVVLSLDADCFFDSPLRLQLARKQRGQRLSPENANLTRLYVVETSSTITGAAADHRLPLGPRGVVAFALAAARRLGLEVEGGEEFVGEEIPQRWVDAVVADLSAMRGRSLVIAGRNQPPVVHAIAHWINSTLGNVGKTVEYRAPAIPGAEGSADSIRELARAMQAKEVAALVILDGNPVYDAPADVNFAEGLKEVPFSVHLAESLDETSMASTWHVPESHLFESWSDTVATDGTASIVQPLIAPLYDGRTVHGVVAALLGAPASSSHDIVRGYWARRLGMDLADPNFESAWQKALHDGVIAGTATPASTPTVAANVGQTASEQAAALLGAGGAKLHVTFRPDPSVWDGRYSNIGWLQELPRPMTKLTWENAALLSPRTARENRVRSGDVIEIEAGGAKVQAAAYVLPGHPDQTITLHLGYGRKNAGRVGNGVGTDVYPVRTTAAAWFAEVSNLRKTGKSVELASTQLHHRMEGRDIVRAGTLEEYRKSPEHPKFMEVGHHGDANISIYPEPVYEGYKWGMVVNQSACIGCNACVVACQSENSIPVVGKEQVARGREMQWLRIDTYYEDRKDEPQNPAVYHQPIMCVHCEYAPCEPVCPVAATTHSEEGLNEMTYNRCVGTRYCSNNCPYKVRRFNFFDFNGELREDPIMQLRPNPDVTIRSRGVMEKCTFCVQRINASRIAADIDNRAIYDGEIVTACQASCPTQAISFGNLNDDRSEVRQLADSSLNYSLLGELNTRPRTTHLALVRNPNPALAQS